MCDRRNGLFGWQSAQGIFKRTVILPHFGQMANQAAPWMKGAGFKHSWGKSDSVGKKATEVRVVYGFD